MLKILELIFKIPTLKILEPIFKIPTLKILDAENFRTHFQKTQIQKINQ